MRLPRTAGSPTWLPTFSMREYIWTRAQTSISAAALRSIWPRSSLLRAMLEQGVSEVESTLKECHVIQLELAGTVSQNGPTMKCMRQCKAFDGRASPLTSHKLAVESYQDSKPGR